MFCTFVELVHKISMKVSNYILINRRKFYLNEWITLSDYSNKYNVNLSTLTNWLYRSVIGKQDYIRVPELNNILLIRDKEYKPRAYNKKES